MLQPDGFERIPTDRLDVRRGLTGQTVTLRINRGEAHDVAGTWVDFAVPLESGMVVLDAVLYVQAHFANDCRTLAGVPPSVILAG